MIVAEWSLFREHSKSLQALGNLLTRLTGFTNGCFLSGKLTYNYYVKLSKIKILLGADLDYMGAIFHWGNLEIRNYQSEYLRVTHTNTKKSLAKKLTYVLMVCLIKLTEVWQWVISINQNQWTTIILLCKELQLFSCKK